MREPNTKTVLKDSFAAAKLNEVQKYASVTNHMWDGWWFLINRRAWSQIPPALQEEMSSRAGARISRVKAGHLTPITRPAEVTKVILSAVDATT